MNLYIFNPEAKNANKLRNKIKKYLSHLNLEGEFVEAKKKEDVAIIATEALNKNIDTIVAIGGDGIVNRIIQVIAGHDINMGIIPIGETNFLASFLGIGNWRKGCEILVRKDCLDINIGKINEEKYFISSIEMESREKEQEYFWNRIFRKKEKKEYVNTIITTKNSTGDGLKVQAECSSIIISTIPFPLSEKTTLKEAMSKEELNIIVKSKSDLLNHTEEITTISGKKINITSKKKMGIKTDGERYGKTDIEVEIIPKALRVILPKEKLFSKSQS